MNAKQIRQTFLDFFASKGHTIVPSAPMVIKNDPTLMFTNAGMNQFKDLFLGNAPIEHSRVADTQKCLRVSGKHNDLEEVGLDTYHHTMFEMLGNWSFGDYFKEEAIAWAWELLTERYKINPERLYVTYFEGDESEGLAPDLEAKAIWEKFIAPERIIPGNKKDNFWEMGDTGPCGPCSEIHVDIRDADEIAKIPGRALVNESHPQVIEIWNNVFMQFNRLSDGSLQPLPAKHVDTGMGFERLCMVLQGKKSNYDTDVFTPIIFTIETLSGHVYGKNEKSDIAMRVIADHVRAVAMAIADGQLPSNTGAGYVIRRILRRAIRYGYSFLDMRKPFIFQLLAPLEDTLGSTFPELTKQKDFIAKVMMEEEASFLRTLETGLSRLHEITQNLQGAVIPGDKVFELYDTFGFPADLTRLIASEQNLQVDEQGFEENLVQQKERSKAAGKITAGDWIERIPTPKIQFLGYDQLTAQSEIVKYRAVQYKGKESYQVVLAQTPFYAESGGQVGDKGILKSAKETIRVKDTVKENDLIIHVTDQLPQFPDEPFEAIVDAHLRAQTANNHSATHLLHAALRSVLGTHVEQRGSLVNADYLRFDFSHPSKLSDEELAQIETIVNEKVRANIPLDEKRDVPFQQAVESGAMALFGEKYGNSVRVITFDKQYSVELCGGTHVQSTGQIGFFKILTESSVAAGVRRIEAITGEKSAQYLNEQLDVLAQVKEILKNKVDPIKGAETLVKENELLKKTVERYKDQEARLMVQHLVQQEQTINGIRVVRQKVQLDAEQMKFIAFELKRTEQNLIVLMAAIEEPKIALHLFISDDLVAKGIQATTIIREIAKPVQGGGGGQPFYATAGGKNPSGLAEAFQKLEEFIPNMD